MSIEKKRGINLLAQAALVVLGVCLCSCACALQSEKKVEGDDPETVSLAIIAWL